MRFQPALIGVLLVVTQLPHLLGLTLPHDADVLAVLDRVGGYVTRAKPFAVAVGVVSLALVLGLPRLSKRIPAPLVAIAVPALLVGLAHLDVPTIDAIPLRSRSSRCRGSLRAASRGSSATR